MGQNPQRNDLSKLTTFDPVFNFPIVQCNGYGDAGDGNDSGDGDAGDGDDGDYGKLRSPGFTGEKPLP